MRIIKYIFAILFLFFTLLCFVMMIKMTVPEMETDDEEGNFYSIKFEGSEKKGDLRFLFECFVVVTS